MFSRKQMIKLLAPLIVEQIMAVLVGMVDVVMVAAVGESAVSGVSLVDSISVLIIQIMGALATGGAVISAQYLGKEQPRDARKAAGQLVLVTLLLSVIIAGTALAGGRHLLGGIFGKVEQDVMDNAQTYFWITALSYPFIGLYNACAALFRSMGNSKVSMMTSFVMNMINIIGNAICVFGLKMGVAGVAWPTLISRVTAAFMMFVLIQNRNNTIRLNSWKFLIPDRHMIKNILSIGIPMGLQFSITAIGTIIVQGAVNVFGSVYIAGFSAAGKIQNIVSTVFVAFGATAATYVGQNRGAGRMDRVHQGVKSIQVMILVWSAVMILVIHLFGDMLIHIFIDASETEVMSAARTYFRAVAWCYPFLGSIFLYRNALQGLGYGLMPMMGGVFELIARAAIVAAVAGSFGYVGVCLADPAAWLAALVPIVPYYFYKISRISRKETHGGRITADVI